MRGNAEIGLQRMFNGFRRNNPLPALRDTVLQCAEHPALRHRPDKPVMGPQDVAEEIDALAIFPDCHFLRMQTEAQMIVQEIPDRRQKSREIVMIIGYDHKIIGIADIVLDSQRMLHELIEWIHVDVCEELRG